MLGLQRSDRKKTKKCWNMRKKIQTNSIFVNECEIDKIFLLQVKGTFVLSLSSKFLPYSPFCPPTNGGDENIKLMWCKLHFIHLQNSSSEWVRFLPIVPPSKFLAGSSLYSCAWFVISNNFFLVVCDSMWLQLSDREGNVFLVTYTFCTSSKIHIHGLTGPPKSYQFNLKILRKIYGYPEQFFTLIEISMWKGELLLKGTHQLSSAGDSTSLKDWHNLISMFHSSHSPTTEHFNLRNFYSLLKKKLR